MNKKCFFLLFPALLLPYITLFALFCVFYSTKHPVAAFVMDRLCFENGLLLILYFLIYLLLALSCGALCILFSVKKREDAPSLFKSVLLLRAIGLPARLFLAVLSLLLLITIFTFAIALIVWFVELLVCLLVAVICLIAMIGENRRTPGFLKNNFWLLFLQIPPGADLISAILLFKRAKKVDLS